MNRTILVVMPAYNAEKTIEQAINSIINQTHEDWVLVVVDDCSTDKTFKIVSKFLDDPRIYLYKNKENRGAYYSRNAGLHVALNLKWQYFTTHDADDISYPDRFERLLRQLEKPRVNGVKDKFRRVNMKTNEVISIQQTAAHAIFKRSVLKSIGFFEEVAFGADWEYWERLRKFNSLNRNFQAIGIEEVLGDAYVGESNLTVLIPEKSEKREIYKIDTMQMHRDMLSNSNFYMPFRFRSTITMPISGDIISGNTTRSSVPRSKRKKNNVVVVLLVWQRINTLRNTLRSLANQTNQNFDVYISNGNLKLIDAVENHVSIFSNKLNIEVSHDGNEHYSFRRMFVGKKLAEAGKEIILFLDDDISFPPTYVDDCLRQYEPKTYKSGYAWSFQDNGQDYYRKRTRIKDFNQTVHYCGTGISMVDAKIFLDKRLFDAPKEAYKIEDLWLSYFVQHVKKWDLKYIELPNAIVGGVDRFALHKTIMNDKRKNSSNTDKADFLRMLVSEYKWKLKA